MEQLPVAHAGIVTGMNPLIICVTGVSGAGKDTLVSDMLNEHPGLFHKFLSTTTRPMREGERDGVDYHFIDQETFDAWLREGRFILNASFAGASYGTLRSEFEGDKPVVAIVVEQTALELKELFGNVIIVNITVPELIIEQRLRDRGDAPEDIAKRLEADAPRRASLEQTADYQIANISREDALHELTDLCLKLMRAPQLDDQAPNVARAHADQKRIQR